MAPDYDENHGTEDTKMRTRRNSWVLPLLLTPSHAADALQVSRSKFYVLVRRGEIPGIVRIGSSLRISRTALEEWILSRSETAPFHHN